MKFKSLWKLKRFILLAYYPDCHGYSRLIFLNFELSWKPKYVTIKAHIETGEESTVQVQWGKDNGS